MPLGKHKQCVYGYNNSVKFGVETIKLGSLFSIRSVFQTYDCLFSSKLYFSTFMRKDLEYFLFYLKHADLGPVSCLGYSGESRALNFYFGRWWLDLVRSASESKPTLTALSDLLSLFLLKNVLHHSYRYSLNVALKLSQVAAHHNNKYHSVTSSPDQGSLIPNLWPLALDLSLLIEVKQWLDFSCISLSSPYGMMSQMLIVFIH